MVTKGLFTGREEDPTRRIMLAPYVCCIQFTCKVVLGPSARIFQTER